MTHFYTNQGHKTHINTQKQTPKPKVGKETQHQPGCAESEFPHLNRMVAWGVRVHASVRACVPVCMSVCAHVCMPVYVCVHVCACLCMCVHVNRVVSPFSAEPFLPHSPSHRCKTWGVSVASHTQLHSLVSHPPLLVWDVAVTPHLVSTAPPPHFPSQAGGDPGQGLPRSLSCTCTAPATNTAVRSPAFCTPVRMGWER